MSKVRAQIMLDANMKQALVKYADDYNVSLGSVIRSGISLYLEKVGYFNQKKQNNLAVFSNVKNSAKDHKPKLTSANFRKDYNKLLNSNIS